MLQHITLIIGLATIWTACDPKATVEDLQRVESEVLATNKEVRLVASATKRETGRIQQVIEQINYRQAATESAFAQMGQGFNQLADAVSVAHDTAERANLTAQKVGERLKERPPVAPTDTEDFEQRPYWGTLRSFAGTITDIGWQRTAEGVFFRVVGARRQRFLTEQIGKRLYLQAADPEAGPWYCMDILNVQTAKVVVADCQNPQWIVEFLAEGANEVKED